jgi:hypothetical protein
MYCEQSENYRSIVLGGRMDENIVFNFGSCLMLSLQQFQKISCVIEFKV